MPSPKLEPFKQTLSPNFLGCILKAGDVVRWTNDNGVVWEHTILGFGTDDDYFSTKYGKRVHLDTESFWFPHSLAELTLIN